MPEFNTGCNNDGEVLVVNTTTGVATYKGVNYSHPCTLEAEDGEVFYKAIPLALFETIDFSRIIKAQTLNDGEILCIDPAAWNHVFMKRRAFETVSTLPGTKRCSC
jgi:hypothetical protein